MSNIIEQEKLLATIERQRERALPTLEQKQINKLYKAIYKFVSAGIEQARRQGKKFLFVIGESHFTYTAKGSLIVERIFMHVAKTIGVTNIFHEGVADSLSVRESFIKDLAKVKREKSAAVYEDIANLLSPSVNAARKFAASDFNHTPIETDPSQTTEKRDHDMARALITFNQSGLLIVGVYHLKGLTEHPQLRENFIIYPVNTQQPDFLNSVYGIAAANQNRQNRERIDFAINKRTAKQFLLNNRLVEVHPDLIIDMVDRAHRKFSRTRTNAIIQPARQATASTPAIEVNRLPSTQPTLNLLPQAKQIAPTSTRNFTPQNPPNGFSIDALIQFGFWAASTLGICASPFYSSVPIEFTNAASGQSRQESLQETSAEAQLTRQGSSLTDALTHLFGRHYTRASQAEQRRLKKFLVDVVNGEVSSEVGHAFNRRANISNANLRYNQLLDLALTNENAQLRRTLHL